MGPSSVSGAGAGSAADDAWVRCPHCAGPLSKEMETSRWTVPPLVRDSFSMLIMLVILLFRISCFYIGSAVGGTTSSFYGFNYVMPTIRRLIKGPMWLHFLFGAPPVIVFSMACAGLAGGSVPALAQLASSSYHAATSSPTLIHQDPQDNNVQKSGSSLTYQVERSMRSNY